MGHKKEKLIPFPVDPGVASGKKTLDDFAEKQGLDRPETDFHPDFLKEAKEKIAKKEPKQTIDEIIKELKKEK